MIESLGIDDVIIHTFGYGDDHDATLMNNIANLKNGGFFYIQNIDSVGLAFADALGGLASVIATDLRLQFIPREGISVLNSWFNPDASEADQTTEAF